MNKLKYLLTLMLFTVNCTSTKKRPVEVKAISCQDQVRASVELADSARTQIIKRVDLLSPPTLLLLEYDSIIELLEDQINDTQVYLDEANKILNLPCVSDDLKSQLKEVIDFVTTLNNNYKESLIRVKALKKQHKQTI